MVNELRSKVTKSKKAVVKVISMVKIEGGGTFGSTGSGFIVNEEGILVTNSHVIINHKNAENSVQFADGTIKKCTKVIHNDPDHDFIILKIEESDYSVLELGEYDEIEEGDDIYFCGYPLMSNHFAINAGIISSKFTESNIRLMQIDGSVNSGNSGGPLLNMDDKVVGIVTQKAGGIDDKLLGISEIVKKSKSGMVINYKFKDGREVKFDPQQALADVIQIIHDYTSVGIGYAFSIEYVKSKLQELNLIK